MIYRQCLWNWIYPMRMAVSCTRMEDGLKQKEEVSASDDNTALPNKRLILSSTSLLLP